MRWLAILLAGLLCLAMTSCPKGDDDTANTVTTNDASGAGDDGGGDAEDWDE